jgi:hypothetical protein
MKTIPRTSKFIVVTASLGLLAVLTFQACVTTLPKFDRQFGIEVNRTVHLFDPVGFIKLLLTGLSKSAVYDFRFVRDDGKVEKYSRGSMLNIKTDNVTMFELPNKGPSGNLTPIGSHVTQRVYSNNLADIQAVLDQLKKQEP